MGVKETFGDRLKRLRGSMNQKDMADALGVSRASIGYYENATRTPDIEMLEKVSRHFGVSYDYLMGESEVMFRENAYIAERTGLSEKAIQKLALINSFGTSPLKDLINLLIEQETLPPEKQKRMAEELEIFYRECREKGYSRTLSAICGYFRYYAEPNSKADIPDVYDTWEKEHETLSVTYTDISALLERGALMEIEEQLKMLRNRVGDLWGKQVLEDTELAEAAGNGDD